MVENNDVLDAILDNLGNMCKRMNEELFDVTN